MLRFPRKTCRPGLVCVSILIAAFGGQATAWAGVTGEEVERAIRGGVRYLKDRQRADGSWAEVDPQTQIGTSCLVTLALLTAGEKPDSATIQQSLDYIRRFRPDQLNSTYGISLQTMVFAAAEPELDRSQIVANVEWLERAQIKPSDRTAWPAPGLISARKSMPETTQTPNTHSWGSNAASEAGVRVRPEIWACSRIYFEESQNRDGGWAYTPRNRQSTASMTCAGISSLIITWLETISGTGVPSGRGHP